MYVSVRALRLCFRTTLCLSAIMSFLCMLVWYIFFSFLSLFFGDMFRLFICLCTHGALCVFLYMLRSSIFLLIKVDLFMFALVTCMSRCSFLFIFLSFIFSSLLCVPLHLYLFPSFSSFSYAHEYICMKFRFAFFLYHYIVK